MLYMLTFLHDAGLRGEDLIEQSIRQLPIPPESEHLVRRRMAQLIMRL